MITAYVTDNTIAAAVLPALVGAVPTAPANVGQPPPAPAEASPKQPTAGQVRKRLTPDGIVKVEDGKAYKSMKLSLAKFGPSPTTCRDNWALLRTIRWSRLPTPSCDRTGA